ncbi:barstar family protein [Micromonospora sp. BRA006-A]|nr:barstar family protein [Micromonospora sp. BRA006-A]
MGAASPQPPAWLVYDGAPPEPDGVPVSGGASRTRAGLHETLAGSLALPGWYGRNWDALPTRSQTASTPVR